MVMKDLKKKNGDELLAKGQLDSAVLAYHKEGKPIEWIAGMIGDFCRQKGQCHEAAEFYRAGGLKEKAKELVDELKKKNQFSFASQIAAISGIPEYYYHDRLSMIKKA